MYIEEVNVFASDFKLVSPRSVMCSFKALGGNYDIAFGKNWIDCMLPKGKL